MFKHHEDGGEIEITIDNDGCLVARCIKCNELWADNFQIVNITRSRKSPVRAGNVEVAMPAARPNLATLSIGKVLIKGFEGEERMSRMNARVLDMLTEDPTILKRVTSPRASRSR